MLYRPNGRTTLERVNIGGKPDLGLKIGQPSTELKQVKDRRSEARFPVDQPITVMVLDSEHAQPSEGTIVDISRSGMGVHLPYAVNVGWRIEIQWSRGKVIAEVRNCRRMSPYRYRVGLKTSEVVTAIDIKSQVHAA